MLNSNLFLAFIPAQLFFTTRVSAMLRNFLFCLPLLALSACNSDSANDYLARAQGAIERSEYAAATIELKNALRLEPESAQARWLLGKIYYDTGDLRSAEKELKRALTQGWPADQIQPLLAQAMLQLGEFEKVRRIRVGGLPSDVQASLFAMQAHAALNMGDTWEAEELIESALGQNPDSIEASMAKARLLVIQDDVEGASATLDHILALDPGHGPAWSLRGNLLANDKDHEGALVAYTKAISLQKDTFNDLFDRAMLNLQLGHYPAAQRDARALLSKSPKHPAANYIQGLLHFQAGSYKKAIASLSVTEAAYKEFPLSLFFLASANLKEGNMELASSQAERFHALVPANVQGRMLLATLRLYEGKYASVQALLGPVLASDPDNINALNLTINALLREGRTDESIELLSRVALLQPDSPRAQIRLGAGLLVGGKTDESVSRLETVLELDPEYELADILIVTSHIQNREFPEAIAAAKAYQGRHPDSVTPYNVLGKVYHEAGDREQALAAFAQVLKLDGADPGANHYLAQISVAENDIPAARKRYETVLVKYPDSMAALIQLALLDAREGDKQAMAAHLQQAAAAEPAALQPRLLLARLYLSQGKPEQVAPLFSNLDSQQQQAPDVLQVMAMAQLSSKDPKAAQFTLEQLLKSAPDSAPIRHVMAMAAAAAGDQDRAVEELQRALKLDENYVPSRIALARIALVQQSIADFKQQLKALTALVPDNPDVLLLQAAGKKLDGNDVAALLFAEKAYEIAPSSATLIALGSYEAAEGNRESVLMRYAHWLEAHPEDIAVRMAYADALLSGQQNDRAGEQYSAVLQADPDNLAALNNLAWITRKQNPAQALGYARKAEALAPDSGEVLDTLAVVEYINKDYRRAERTIGRALEATPDNPSIIYHSAMIAAALDDKSAARKTLTKLLGANAGFPESAEAQALLDSLGN